MVQVDIGPSASVTPFLSKCINNSPASQSGMSGSELGAAHAYPVSAPNGGQRLNKDGYMPRQSSHGVHLETSCDRLSAGRERRRLCRSEVSMEVDPQERQYDFRCVPVEVGNDQTERNR